MSSANPRGRGVVFDEGYTKGGEVLSIERTLDMLGMEGREGIANPPIINLGKECGQACTC